MVALAVILGLLYGSFRRWRLALLAILTLPMALVGGVLAAWLTSATMTIGSFVGLFTVLGIAARNGILLISHCQHLEAVEGVNFGPDLVLAGLPRAAGPDPHDDPRHRAGAGAPGRDGGRPGHEIEYPMAIVILGGLLTSTLLNLFVVPSLYLRFGRAKAPLHRGDSARPGRAAARVRAARCRTGAKPALDTRFGKLSSNTALTS